MTKVALIAAVVSGVFWGSWPLFMNRSSLGSYVAPGVFSAVSLAVILSLTFRYYSWNEVAKANWEFVFLAGVCAAIGTIVFIGKMPAEDLDTMSKYYVTNLVAQVCVPAVVSVYLSGASPAKILGFLFAGLAAVLLKM